MALDFSRLDSLTSLHEQAGQRLFAACEGNVFPCDGLALSILERSLHIAKAVKMILADGGYSCAVALVRLQLV
jgi:hypothetical protein